MPCMKDYGKTWDESGIFPHVETYVRFDWINKTSFMSSRRSISPRYRKIANQYGVCKFVRIEDD